MIIDLLYLLINNLRNFHLLEYDILGVEIIGRMQHLSDTEHTLPNTEHYVNVSMLIIR